MFLDLDIVTCRMVRVTKMMGSSLLELWLQPLLITFSTQRCR
jgi:hypothetical protein